jgi:hypothetical protein
MRVRPPFTVSLLVLPCLLCVLLAVTSLDPQDGGTDALLERNRVSASGWNKATWSLQCPFCIVLTAGRAKAGPSSWQQYIALFPFFHGKRRGNNSCKTDFSWIFVIHCGKEDGPAKAGPLGPARENCHGSPDADTRFLSKSALARPSSVYGVPSRLAVPPLRLARGDIA